MKISLLLIIGLLITVLSPVALYVVAQDQIVVSDKGSFVVVDNGVLRIEFLKQGVRARSWLIKSSGLDLAANSGSRGDMGRSYPLWDWLTNQPWPGELCLNTYTFKLVEKSSSKAVLEFSTNITQGDVAGLTVKKTIVVYYGKYYLDIVVTIENPTSKSITIRDTFYDGKLGYTFAWAGVLGNSGLNDLQAWKYNDITITDKKEHFVRDDVTNLKWIAVYDAEEGCIAAIIIHNKTAAVWREADPNWGTEVRVEFPSTTVGAGKKISYVFNVYGGPIDARYLSEIGLQEMARRFSIIVRATTDKVVYTLGEKAELTVNVTNNGAEDLRADVKVDVYLKGVLKYSTYIAEDVTVASGQTYRISKYVDLPAGEGIVTFIVKVLEDDTELSSIFIRAGVADPSKRKPLYIAFVWHHHQAPNFYPNGVYHGLWAFVHTYENEFSPYYEGGAYLVHTYIHEQVPEIKDNDHLSPSLLYQWHQAITEGYKTSPYSKVKPDDPRVQRVKEALNNYKQLYMEGRIEILTSFFAHPIAGYEINYFSSKGFGDTIYRILKWELLYGKKITEEVTGAKPEGAWTPEMFWDMKLVKLYNESGVRYTVLCSQHFYQSRGDKGTIYEPYVVEDKDSGRTIIVFFRDQGLSDWIGFNNNMPDVSSAEENARNYVLALFELYMDNPGKLVVIALDGENWMLMARFPSTTPVFLRKMWEYIASAEVFRTVTLNEALKIVPPRRVLTYIPTGSWIGLTASQWTGGVKDQLWSYVADKMSTVDAYLSLIPNEYFNQQAFNTSSRLYEVLRAISIALDSDYYWYGEYEGNQKVIKMWADKAEELALSELSKVKIISVNVEGGIKEGEEALFKVAVKNEFQYNVVISLKFSSDEGVIETKTFSDISVPPGESQYEYKVKCIKGGSGRVRVDLVLGTISVSSIEVEVSAESVFTIPSYVIAIIGIIVFTAIIVVIIIKARSIAEKEGAGILKY